MSTSAYEAGMVRESSYCNHYKHDDGAERISYSMSGMPEMTTTATNTVNIFKHCLSLRRRKRHGWNSSFLSLIDAAITVRNNSLLVRKHTTWKYGDRMYIKICKVS